MRIAMESCCPSLGMLLLVVGVVAEDTPGFVCKESGLACSVRNSERCWRSSDCFLHSPPLAPQDVQMAARRGTTGGRLLGKRGKGGAGAPDGRGGKGGSGAGRGGVGIRGRSSGRAGSTKGGSAGGAKVARRGSSSIGGSKGGSGWGIGAAKGLFGVGAVPVFMPEEDPSRLMRHTPPYGYRFGSHSMAQLLVKRANATLPRQRKLGTCAVVGSSGTLLSHALGKEIDEHQSVIRINGAPLNSRFASHTGMKTTVRFFASPHAASDFRFHEEKQYIDETVFVVCDRPFVYSCQNVLFARRKDRWHNINPVFYAAVRRSLPTCNSL